MSSPADALQLLAVLGASRRLIRHHELVTEAAQIRCDRLARELMLDFDPKRVLHGEPGHEHEDAGPPLLAEGRQIESILVFVRTKGARLK